MGWEKEVEELRRREAMARRIGGPDKIKFAHPAAPMSKPGPRSFGYRP
jgi:hypothetical protein